VRFLSYVSGHSGFDVHTVPGHAKKPCRSIFLEREGIVPVIAERWKMQAERHGAGGNHHILVLRSACERDVHGGPLQLPATAIGGLGDLKLGRQPLPVLLMDYARSGKEGVMPIGSLESQPVAVRLEEGGAGMGCDVGVRCRRLGINYGRAGRRCGRLRHQATSSKKQRRKCQSSVAHIDSLILRSISGNQLAARKHARTLRASKPPKSE
jgi:hypothetical protein